jgi:hypothetical protein
LGCGARARGSDHTLATCDSTQHTAASQKMTSVQGWEIMRER